MYTRLVSAVFASVLLGGGAVLLDALPQDRTAQPGQPTQGKVWIQNRGDGEAVPVVISQNAGLAPSVRVQVAGNPAVALVPGTVVEARLARQSWEYKNVPISPGQDAAGLLNALGPDGWDTTGVTVTDQGRTIVVLKRPTR